MLKLTLQLKEVEDTMNIALLDPTKKQLSEATENEKMLAQTNITPPNNNASGSK